jgi:ABC-type multidrug transport system fused ATPase/permease subunit
MVTFKRNKKTKDSDSMDVEKKKASKPEDSKVSILQLFRFSTTKEKILMLIALICSAGSGALQPFSILIYGQYINNLSGSLNEPSNLLNQTAPVIRTMALMATGVLVTAYVSNALWISIGESQTRRIRTLYVHSVLRQDLAWFDKAEEGSLTTRLATDTQLIQDGISEKFGQLVMLIAQFIGGFLVAFIKGNYVDQFMPCHNAKCMPSAIPSGAKCVPKKEKIVTILIL